MIAKAQPLTGNSAMALAVAFNAPYAVLAATFDYPGILRQPAATVLARFAEGGPPLILTWYAFGASAMALVPLATALTITPERLTRAPGLAIGAAVAGALAGVTQAIGLFRWVFAVPGFARTAADPASGPLDIAAATQAFVTLNQFAGAAIGEHLGQLLTALFVLMVALMQLGEARIATGRLGLAAAAAVAVGTGEGVALALGASGALFSLSTIAGYLLFAGWLFLTGAGLLTARRSG
jgi:hypothetical protein